MKVARMVSKMGTLPLSRFWSKGGTLLCSKCKTMGEGEGKNIVEEEAGGVATGKEVPCLSNWDECQWRGHEGAVVGRKRDTPIVLLLEQGREAVPPRWRLEAQE